MRLYLDNKWVFYIVLTILTILFIFYMSDSVSCDGPQWDPFVRTKPITSMPDLVGS